MSLEQGCLEKEKVMLKLSQPTADLFVPSGIPLGAALSRTTCLGVGAHPDDLEFWMYYPILKSYGDASRWFTGVTVTNGAGSVRSGAFKDFTDDQMIAERRKEQCAAARIGKYKAMLQLDHPSSAVKDRTDMSVVDDLEAILRATTPRDLYTHDIFDRHDTHRGVLFKVIEACRRLPMEARPKRLIGCEGWGSLDWLVKGDKLIMDISGSEDLAHDLISQFPSQAGKDYVTAVEGRRRANATLLDGHVLDTATSVIFGLDMTDLINEKDLHPYKLGERYMRAFYEEKMNQLA